jgi:hypothetical protein
MVEIGITAEEKAIGIGTDNVRNKAWKIGIIEIEDKALPPEQITEINAHHKDRVRVKVPEITGINRDSAHNPIRIIVGQGHKIKILPPVEQEPEQVAMMRKSASGNAKR